MNHSARRKMLKFFGTFMVVLLPVVLALWFAHIRAMSETRNQLSSFAQLVLNKTELVILQADLARDMAQLYQGKMCTPAHQKSGNDSNLLIVFYVQIMPDDFVMQLHRF